MKPTTDAQQQQRLAARCRKDVCRLLQLEEGDYFNIQFEAGLDYLTHYLRDGWAIDILKSNRSFWKWWTLHWASRDSDFLVYSQGGILTLEEARGMYLRMHDGYELSRSIQPSGIILEDSYALMMQQFIDETLQPHA